MFVISEPSTVGGGLEFSPLTLGKLIQFDLRIFFSNGLVQRFLDAKKTGWGTVSFFFLVKGWSLIEWKMVIFFRLLLEEISSRAKMREDRERLHVNWWKDMMQTSGKTCVDLTNMRVLEEYFAGLIDSVYPPGNYIAYINISHLGKFGKSSTQKWFYQEWDMWSFPGGFFSKITPKRAPKSCLPAVCWLSQFCQHIQSVPIFIPYIPPVLDRLWTVMLMALLSGKRKVGEWLDAITPEDWLESYNKADIYIYL